MASRTINIETIYEAEGGGIRTITFNPASTSGSYTDGDILTWKWLSHSGGSAPASVKISGWSGTAWVNTNIVTLTFVGDSEGKTVKSSPTPQADGLLVYNNGSKPYTANITSATDSTPDAFDYGNITNALPNNEYTSYVTITGITVSVTATVSGGLISTDGITFTGGSLSVSNNQRVYLRSNAPSGYNQNSSATVTVGGVSDVRTIYTKTSAPPQSIVPLGITAGLIKLSQLKIHFGGTTLKTFLRGGSYVPDGITENNGIPITLPINLTDFYGSATTLYWSKLPTAKYIALNASGTGTVSLQWDDIVDFDVGYGSSMIAVAHKKYTINETYGSATFTSQSGSPTTFSQNNNWVKVSITGTDKEAEGEITLTIKHPSDTGNANTITITFNYTLIIYQ